MNSNQKGDIAEAKVVLESRKLGYPVSKPFGDCPYDMIIDKCGKLYRVQVKYVSPRKGVLFVPFETKSRTRNRACYNSGNIDALVIYNPSTEILYWIDVEEFDGGTSISIRVERPKNGQIKGIKLAVNYTFI